jgi:hypothetical protein
MALHHHLPRLVKLDLPLFIHDVIERLLTELLHQTELLQRPYPYLCLLYFSSSPYFFIKSLFINFYKYTFDGNYDVENLSHFAHAAV